MMTPESLHLDVEDIHAGRKSRETQMAPASVAVTNVRRQSAPAKRLARLPRNDAAMGVLEGADQRTRRRSARQ